MSESSNSQYISDLFNKLLLVFAILCYLGASIILGIIPPASGYEYSLYEIYPLVFWTLIGILFFLPFVYLFTTISDRFRVSFQKKTAYGLLILSFATLLLSLYIPATRGYVMYAGGDTHTHLGYVLDICNSGSFGINLYPYSHVLVSIKSMMTGIQGIALTPHINPIFSALFIITIFCLSRSIGCTPYQVVAITAFAIIPIMGSFMIAGPIMPSAIGWQLIPLFFYCLYKMGFSKKNFTSYHVLGIILCAVFWYVHPETVLFLAIMVLTLIVAFMVAETFFKQQHFIQYTPFILIFLLLVIGIIYHISFTWVLSNQIDVYSNIFFGEPTQTLTHSPLKELSSDATFQRKIIILMENYGQLVFLSFLCMLFFLYLFFSQRLKTWNRNYLLVSILFIVAVLQAAFFLALGTATGVHVFRQFKYIVLFSFFLVGFYINDVLLIKGKNYIQILLSLIITISLILIIFFSIGNLFPCPEIGQANPHVTQQDISGMQVFYENRDTSYLISETLMRQHQMRYNHLLYGISQSLRMSSIRGIADIEIIPPSGFGYGMNEMLGEQYTSETYFLKYPPVKPYTRRFMDTEEYFADITPEDYQRLDTDYSVNGIQDGGALQIYLIVPPRLNNH